MPGLVEGDDFGTWVVKFRGAGQGPKALVAEIVCGQLALALGLNVPELVIMEMDPLLGRAEPDPEIQDLLRGSAGPNLGMDFLPGSVTYDPVAPAPGRPIGAPAWVDPGLAARVLWFDALVLNIDRTWRNPNLLVWGSRIWLIDHGAALYPQHDWARAGDAVDRVLPRWTEHVLLPLAAKSDAPMDGAASDPAASLAERIRAADAALAPLVTAQVLRAATADVPEDWLDVDRSRYVDWLLSRVGGARPWVDAMTRVPPDALPSAFGAGVPAGAGRGGRPGAPARRREPDRG
ncbi:MAG: HipA family kinase [Frankia sp.]